MTDGTIPQDDASVRQQVITNTDISQLVSCGAGGGKTSLLVNHYVHLLATGVSPYEIVAVTFTEAAAAELKERLRRECREQATKTDNGSTDWKALAREIETAPVSTIHGFCARILREHALAAGVDPAFTVLDQTQSRLLLAEMVRQSLLDGLSRDRMSAARLVGELGLKQAVDQVAGLVERRAQLGDWLMQTWAAADLAKHWNQHVDEALAQGISELIASPQWKAAIEALQEFVSAEKGSKLATTLGEILNLACKVEKEPTLEALQALRQCKVTVSTGKDPDAQCVKAAEAARSLKNKDGAIAKRIDALLALKPEPADSPAALLTEALLAETKEAVKAYEAAKAEQHALDFEDLQLRVRDLWQQKPGILEQVRGGTKHLLIDEYQDTSRLQEEILGALAGEGGAKRFLVGDPKQSIYGWRDADLTVWYDTHQNMTEASGADGYVTLKKCFRSTPTLLCFFNKLFKHPAVMGEPPAEPKPYEAYYETELEAHRTDESKPAVELLLVSASSDDAEVPTDEGEEIQGESAATVDLRFAEAKRLAKRVSELVSGSEPLQVLDRETGKHRAAEFRDFAMLLSSFSDVGIYEWAFRQAGIPTYVYAGKGYFSVQEVRDVTNALRTIENSEDEVALVGALRSPLFGLSDETLFWIANKAPGITWWKRLESASAEDSPLKGLVDDSELARLCQATALLRDLRARKNHLRLSELIGELLKRTQLLAILASLPNAAQTTANLQKLLDIAAAYELTGSYSLRGFLNWLQELQVRVEREGEAAIENEKSNSVKFMTQHSAKGLEWPVVLLPDLHRQPRRDRDVFRWHTDLGCMAFKKQDTKDGQPGFWQLLGDRRKAEKVAERRRLFYVACTRARDRLILASGVKLNTQKEKVDLREDRPLAWLLKAFGLSAEELAALVTDGCEKLPLNDCWSDLVQGSLYSASEGEPVAGSQGAGPASPQPEGLDSASVKQLAAQVGPVQQCYGARRRFTATELAVYGFCPRRYELTYIAGWPTEQVKLPTLSAGDKLTEIERGEVIHHLLRLVGTKGAEELDQVLKSNLGLPPDLEVRAKQQKDELWQQLALFLKSELYLKTILAAPELRTEMPVVFPLCPACDGLPQTVAVEGVLDAFVIDCLGQTHILDYKTGSPDDADDQGMYKFQIGLYCAAVKKWLEKYPAKAWLVYLQPDKTSPLELDVSSIAKEAVKQACQMVAAIWKGAFTPPESPPCPSCPLGKWCPDCQWSYAPG